jgi:hypothetical protein
LSASTLRSLSTSSPFLADHDPRTRRVNGDPRGLRGALDHDAAHGGVVELLLDKARTCEIGDQLLGIVLAVRIPDRSVVLDDAKADARGMYFLTHVVSPRPQLSPSATFTVIWQLRLKIRSARPLARGAALHRHALVDKDRRHLELVDICALVVLGIGDRRIQHLADDVGGLLVAEFSTDSASSTGLPRTWSATSRAFCAEMRAPFNLAATSIVVPVSSRPVSSRRRSALGLLVHDVPLEGSRTANSPSL